MLGRSHIHSYADGKSLQERSVDPQEPQSPDVNPSKEERTSIIYSRGDWTRRILYILSQVLCWVSQVFITITSNGWSSHNHHLVSGGLKISADTVSVTSDLRPAARPYFQDRWQELSRWEKYSCHLSNCVLDSTEPTEQLSTLTRVPTSHCKDVTELNKRSLQSRD